LPIHDRVALVLAAGAARIQLAVVDDRDDRHRGSPAEVRSGDADDHVPGESGAKEKTLKNAVVRVRAFFRPQRPAIAASPPPPS